MILLYALLRIANWKEGETWRFLIYQPGRMIHDSQGQRRQYEPVNLGLTGKQ